MSPNELRAKWQARADELERLGALVPAGPLCRALLDDLAQLGKEEAEAALSLREAAEFSGYSKDHLSRLVKQGKLRTLRPPGSRGRYAFQRADLPQKPGARHTVPAGVHDLASRLYRGKEGRNGHF